MVGGLLRERRRSETREQCRGDREFGYGHDLSPECLNYDARRQKSRPGAGSWHEPLIVLEVGPTGQGSASRADRLFRCEQEISAGARQSRRRSCEAGHAMERRIAMCDALAGIHAWVSNTRLACLRDRLRQLQYRAGRMIVVQRVSGLRAGQKQTCSEADEKGLRSPTEELAGVQQMTCCVTEARKLCSGAAERRCRGLHLWMRTHGSLMLLAPPMRGQASRLIERQNHGHEQYQQPSCGVDHR